MNVKFGGGFDVGRPSRQNHLVSSGQGSSTAPHLGEKRNKLQKDLNQSAVDGCLLLLVPQ